MPPLHHGPLGGAFGVSGLQVHRNNPPLALYVEVGLGDQLDLPALQRVGGPQVSEQLPEPDLIVLDTLVAQQKAPRIREFCV